jgi:ribosomal protein RSM22 (predicted rRNA methylase)
MSFWKHEELQILSRLREGFLTGSAGAADYWRGEEELSLYERTFAQRIGWKWEAVLGELTLRHWVPPSEHLVDWGCGTGIASRRVLEHWPGLFKSLSLCDRSPQARAFARERVRASVPEVNVRAPGPDETDCDGAVVLVSHVLSELNGEQLRKALLQWKRAAAVIWVESATHDNARRLVAEAREPLLKTGWKAVAPCTHGGRCPLLLPENERHWCHHFARVPSEVHQDQAWRELSQRLNLDLRVLPYSFLVLENGERAPQETGWSRVIGTPRELKGHLKVLACDERGVRDWVLQKRDSPELFKELRKGENLPLHRWRVEGQKIVGVV